MTRQTTSDSTPETHRAIPQAVELLIARLEAVGAQTDQSRSLTAEAISAFEEYGLTVGRSGAKLEEALSGALRAYQVAAERSGGPPDDSATVILAGIVLAASVRGFQSLEQSDPSPNEERQSVWLRTLTDINRAATARWRLSEILDLATRTVVTSTGASASAIFLHEPVTSTLVLRAAAGLNPSAVNALVVASDSGITGLAINSRRVQVVPDAPHHPAWVSTPEMGDDIYSTQVSVPLVSTNDAEPVGVLNALYVENALPGEEELAFLQVIADELAIVISNAQLLNRTDAALQRKIVELGTLQRVTRTIASSLDLQNVLQSISDAAIELTRAEAAAVFRLSPGHEPRVGNYTPTIQYRSGPAREIVNESDRNLLIQGVINSGEAQATDLAYVDGISRLYCLPLRSARRTWGAICLRLDPERNLTEDDLGILQAFTDFASLAIENAELYQEARKGLDTASTLLQEMHHRVRNNLQTVAALLSLQMRQVGSPEVAQHLREAATRVQAIASVHDLLSDEKRLSAATVSEVVQIVVSEAQTMMVTPGLSVDFQVSPSDVLLTSRQATLLALVVNELVSNAVMHGFEGRSRGQVKVRSGHEDGHAFLEVENDGAQVPEGFDPVESKGLGMRIVQQLVTADLKGAFTIKSSPMGTLARIVFPVAVT